MLSRFCFNDGVVPIKMSYYLILNNFVGQGRHLLCICVLSSSYWFFHMLPGSSILNKNYQNKTKHFHLNVQVPFSPLSHRLSISWSNFVAFYLICECLGNGDWQRKHAIMLELMHKLSIDIFTFDLGQFYRSRRWLRTF